MTFARGITWACGIALAVIPAISSAAPAGKAKDDKAAVEIKTVELFDAMNSGDLDVKFVAKNSRDGQLIVKNNTDQPLTVKLPDAFAAVPVLAQAAAAGGNRSSSRNGGNRNNNTQNQGVGGGFGGGGIGGGGIGGGGAFNIAAERVAKIKVQTVCLEHGKHEPTAAIPYEIQPIESFISDPKVQEVCKILGTGEVNQHAAQAAAWHLANHMTWEQLIDKKTHHLLGADEIVFSTADIREAMQITDKAIKAAEARESGSSTPAVDTTAASSAK